MTAPLDYGALPPEVNSARMYTGAGSRSLLAAAAGWEGLAAELRSQAAGYDSVVSGLAGQGWRGPASLAMAAAAAPYAAWMNATAAQAEQTGAQAKAAAAAYEVAFSLTVPPPVIAANRAQLASLMATNILGQNTAAIAATEAHYAEMWAQDAVAMYDYAARAAAATELTPFAAPAQTTNPAALAAQSAAVSAAASTTSVQSPLTQLLSSVPNALQGLTSPGSWTSSASSELMGVVNLLSGNGSGTGLSGIYNDVLSSNGLGLNNNLWNTIFSSGFYMPGNFLGNMVDFLALTGVEAGAGDAVGGAANQLGAAAGAPLANLGGLGNAISAGLGKATTLGPLSVPPSWTSIATPSSPLASSLGATPLTAPPSMPGVAGMPMPSAAAATGAANVPKYGFRPGVVARPPAAG